MPLPPGLIIGNRWQIRELVSQHTHLLYSATDTKLHMERLVVVKTIHYSQPLSPQKITTLRRLFSCQLTVLSLGHYYLPEPLDYFTIENTFTPGIAGTDLSPDEPVLVYSYSPGSPLFKHLRQEGPLSPALALNLFFQLGEFLSFLHEEGWLYLGINPSHIIWKDDSFRIVGFGNFLPLNKTKGFAADVTYFNPPQDEQVYLPTELLPQKLFGSGAEYYSLCLLYYFAITGANIDKIAKSRSLKPELLNPLPIPPELKEALGYFLQNYQEGYSPEKDNRFRQTFLLSLPLQKAYDRDQKLKKKTAAIFADYAALFRSLRQQITIPGKPKPKTIFPYDLEGIAYPIFRQHPEIYKVALVPSGWGTNPKVVALNRDGWLITKNSSLAQEVKNFLNKANPQHLIFITSALPPELANLTSTSVITPNQVKSSLLAQQETTENLLTKIGLLSRDYAEHKHLLWEFLIQTGASDRALSLLQTLHSQSKGQSLVTRLARCPIDLYPSLIKAVISHPKPATVEKLLSFAIMLGKVKFEAISSQLDLILRLLEQYKFNQIYALFTKYGLPVLQVIDQHGSSAIKAINLFGKEGLKWLQTANAPQLLTILQNEQLLNQLRHWYHQHHNLNIIPILLEAPQLLPEAHHFGNQTINLYNTTRDVGTVKRIAVIAYNTGLSLSDADKLKSALPNIKETIIMGITRRFSSLLHKSKVLDDHIHTVAAIHKAQQNKDEAELLQLIANVEIAAPLSYHRWGKAIFHLAQNISPEVLPLLCHFPKFFPALQHYGTKAYLFLKTFTAEAERLVERLEETANLANLQPWLDPPLFDLLKEWYGKKGSLAPVYWVLHYPDLKPIFDKYGYIAATAFELTSRSHPEPVRLLAEVTEREGADGLAQLLSLKP